MSKMGQFVFEVQELVCDNFNEPFSVVEEKVRARFGPNSSYAIQVAKSEYDQILTDFDEFSKYIASGDG